MDDRFYSPWPDRLTHFCHSAAEQGNNWRGVTRCQPTSLATLTIISLHALLPTQTRGWPSATTTVDHDQSCSPTAAYTASSESAYPCGFCALPCVPARQIVPYQCSQSPEPFCCSLAMRLAAAKLEPRASPTVQTAFSTASAAYRFPHSLSACTPLSTNRAPLFPLHGPPHKSRGRKPGSSGPAVK